MKVLLFVFMLSSFERDSFAGDERKLPWSRQTIRFMLKNFLIVIKENSENIENEDRLIGKRANDWDDCWRIYNEAVRKRWMTAADVEDWKEEKATPKFVKGEFAGIGKQCGCFHPASLIDVFDPIAGKKMELEPVRH